MFSENRNFIPLFLFILCTIVYVLGLTQIDLMDIDSAQYGCISFEMFQNKSYLQVIDRGHDYLDKPPLLFWLGSLFFSIFGVSDAIFRLPSFLFTLLGVYSTFRLGEMLYNRKAGILAALILYSCQAYFLFNHDVRTDCLLTNSVIFAVWQLWAHIQTGRVINLILGFVGIGLAMLAKGPIGLVVPAFAIGSELLLKKRFKEIFQIKWIGGLLFVLIMLSPMVYGLYEQHGMKGVKFFFWTQSFGRITGESEWQNEGTVLFFTHTFVWSFLPWTFFAIAAFAEKIIGIIKSKFKTSDEVLSLAGFLLTFIALSSSRYKLPHYIFVTYPFAALFTAQFIVKFIEQQQQKTSIGKILIGFQWLSIVLLLAGAFLIMLWVFPGAGVWIWLVISLFLGLMGYVFFMPPIKGKIILISLLCVIAVNLVLSAHFYPTLLQYQSGSVAAKYLSSQQVDKEKVFYFNEFTYAFDFYLHHQVPFIGDMEKLKQMLNEKKELWIYTNEDNFNSMHQQNFLFKEVKKYDHLAVTRLSITFLNPMTRAEAVRPTYLVKIIAPE